MLIKTYKHPHGMQLVWKRSAFTRLKNTYTKLANIHVYNFCYCRICFVQFDTPESLKTNMEKKDGVELQGRSLYVDYAGNKGGGGGGAGGDRRRSSGGGQEGV